MAKLKSKQKQQLPSSPSAKFVSITEVYLDKEQKHASQKIPIHQIEEMMEQLHQSQYTIPLYVTPVENRYKVVGNGLVFFATQALGRKNVYIEIHSEPLSLADRVRNAENPIALAKIYAQALREFHCTQEILSAKLGKSRPSIANTLRLLSLPTYIRQDIEKKELLVGHGLALLRLSKEKQKVLYQEITDRKYTVKESEDRAKELSVKISKEQHLEDLCSVMIERFDARAKIHQKGTCISISFSSQEELLAFLKSKK